MRRGHTALVALGLGFGLIVPVGCTARATESLGSGIPATAKPKVATTTTDDSSDDDTVTPSTLAGQTPDEIKASLTAAVTSRNFCAFTSALDDAVPDVSDGAAVISTYEALDAAVKDARAFRPAGLADAWDVVISGVEEGVAAAERVGGDLSDPAMRAPFTAGDFQAAMAEVESWSDTNCPTG